MQETIVNELFRTMNATLEIIVGFAILGALNTPLFAVALAGCLIRSTVKIFLKLLQGLTIVIAVNNQIKD